MNAKDGGPAFPRARPRLLGSGDLEERDVGGMSLRDYFAAAALQGLTAQHGKWLERQSARTGNDIELAMMAYVYADAMLSERNKP